MEIATTAPSQTPTTAQSSTSLQQLQMYLQWGYLGSIDQGLKTMATSLQTNLSAAQPGQRLDETTVLQLQQLLNQRQIALNLVSQIMSSHHQNMMAVIRNIGRN